ncbi:MAG TPA: hypothetical protein VFS60_12460 [Thermoanaerobaculia bacterium]|jgi:hypothetical protein|nr:hypothetical protein [Thermoanaerobaculia bacterium]
MSTPMTVYVTINKSGTTYASSNPAVESDGTINIDAGEKAEITFEPAAGQGWFFVSPWVVISPTGGDVTFISGAATAVVIEDNNPDAPESTYTYCLQTTSGALDPRLINKGGN